MDEETLLDQLNDLCENILCPMDLMDSISDYTNEKIVEELKKLKIENLGMYNGVEDINIHKRIQELER
jgi:hypothetical protein